MCVRHCMCVCVKTADGFFPAASLLSSVTILKQLVLVGRTPSALHENSLQRDSSAAHDRHTHREGVVGARLLDLNLWTYELVSLIWQSLSFLFFKRQQ